MSSGFFVQRLDPRAVLPTRGSTSAAGLDLASMEMTTIAPNSGTLIATGLAFVIPEGYYGRVAPRSGISVKHNLIINAGVIDSDYRGEVRVVVYNPTQYNVTIYPGQKFAQLILERISLADPVEVEDIKAVSQTERGANGFGSTDKSPNSQGEINYIV